MTKLEKQLLAEEQMATLASCKPAKKRKGKINYKDVNLINILNPFLKKDITKFRAKSHNKDKAILEFYQYAYFDYKVPLWLLTLLKTDAIFHNHSLDKEEVSIENKSKTIQLIEETSFFNIFKAISENTGLKKVIPFSKKEIHLILNSKKLTLPEAVHEAFLINIGVKKEIITLILNIGNIYGASEEVLYRYKFVKKYEDMLSQNMIIELFDYFDNYDDVRYNYKTFYTRNIDRMIADSNAWHIQIIKRRSGKNLVWNSAYERFTFEKDEENIYFMKELNTSSELSREGSEMGHCVGSYSRKCVDGHTSILSFGKRGTKEKKTRLTIEVNNRRKTIVQIQGLYNQRGATNSEMFIIQKFAIKHGLDISRYLLR